MYEYYIVIRIQLRSVLDGFLNIDGKLSSFIVIPSRLVKSHNHHCPDFSHYTRRSPKFCQFNSLVNKIFILTESTS